MDSDIFPFSKNPATEALSGKLEDSIPELSGVAASFLEAVGVFDAKYRFRRTLLETHFGVSDAGSQTNAEKLFLAVHKFWTNERFVPLLYEVSDKGCANLLGLTYMCGKRTSFSLHLSRVHFIRKDPSLKDILNETDPSVRLRGAISILIRYWCMDNMMEEYFFKNFGLYALGLDISFAAAPQETPLKEKERRPITMPYFSPIGQLVNVPSIQRLAQDVKKYPKLVELAEKLLVFLKDDHFDVKPVYGSKKPYVFHCEAMWDFWRDQDFRVLMRVRLLEDPHFLVMVSMFSDQFKREIMKDRLQHIHLTLLPELEFFLGFGGFDLNLPVDRTRCAFSIMMKYWASLGVAARLREKWGFTPWTFDGKPLMKYSDKTKEEQIGEVLYYPVHNDEVHNDDPADCNFMLTRWFEANEMEINRLLDKEWTDVLTGRYSTGKAEIESLLGKIDLDTRLNLVMKKDNDGKLCMTCTKLTQVARSM